MLFSFSFWENMIFLFKALNKANLDCWKYLLFVIALQTNLAYCFIYPWNIIDN